MGQTQQYGEDGIRLRFVSADNRRLCPGGRTPQRWRSASGGQVTGARKQERQLPAFYLLNLGGSFIRPPPLRGMEDHTPDGRQVVEVVGPTLPVSAELPPEVPENVPVRRPRCPPPSICPRWDGEQTSSAPKRPRLTAAFPSLLASFDALMLWPVFTILFSKRTTEQGGEAKS